MTQCPAQSGDSYPIEDVGVLPEEAFTFLKGLSLAKTKGSEAILHVCKVLAHKAHSATEGRSIMNSTKMRSGFTKGLILFMLLGSMAVFSVTGLAAARDAAWAGNTSVPLGKGLALTGEVVMIEGNVEIVEDPSDGKKDAFLVMEHLYVAQVAGDEAIEFRVNDSTQVDEDLRVGDKVEVVSAQNGEALSIKKTE